MRSAQDRKNGLMLELEAATSDVTGGGDTEDWESVESLRDEIDTHEVRVDDTEVHGLHTADAAANSPLL